MFATATGIDAPCSSPAASNMGGTPLGTNKSLKLNFTSKTPGRGKGKEKMDRFIPNRAGYDVDQVHYKLVNENQAAHNSSQSPGKEEYKQLLAASLNVEENGKILAFKQKAPAPPPGHENNLRSLYSQNVGPAPNRKQFRHIPQTQERILDAPDIVDDYYLNLLDWNSTNVIAVALGASVYLWNAGTGDVEELCHCPNEGDYISSVSWALDGTHVAVGTSDCKVQIWDAARMKQVRELVGHTNRVSSLSWNNTILSSGGRDSVICNWDVRKRKDQANVATLTTHEQEVCGLKWSLCGQQLASGANDNMLCIWDSSFKMQHQIHAHQAAVKALAWCPFQSNLIATGGGTADRCLKFWNTHTGALVNSVDTGSQVCAIQWSRHEKEVLSSHGYSKNQLCLWKYPSLVKIGELTGHTGRVLHMAQSPDGSSVVSAGADETLRFWRAFGDPPVAKEEKVGAVASGQSFLRSVRIR